MRALLGFLILAMPAIAGANIFDDLANQIDDLVEEERCGCVIDCRSLDIGPRAESMHGESESLGDDVHSEAKSSCEIFSSDDRIPESCLQDE